MAQHPMRTLREKHGLSLRDLARIAGTHHPTIWKYEQGTTPMRVTYLRPIARFLDVPMSSLAAPGQPIVADTPEDLNELVETSDPQAVVAQWLGRNINEAGTRLWLAEIKEALCHD